MSTFRSILLMALLVGQTSGFIASNQSSKAVVALQSTYNRNYNNYDQPGRYNDRYNDVGNIMRGSQFSDYDRRSYNRGGDYNRGRYNEFDHGYNSYDRGYGGMSMSRSKYGDWLNGSSNYIPTGADRNYVMNRGYETNGGPYNNYYTNGDRFNNRYNNGYNSRDYGYNGRNSMDYNRRNSMDYNRGNSMGYNRGNSMDYNRGNSMDYNRGNSMDYNRYSPVNYRDGGNYNRNNDRTFRSAEYGRTFRSPMDSHRQDYPSYTMGRMEDQFGSKKWWDSN